MLYLGRLTGASYNGKSTGAGALAIWTHNLKSIDFVDYHSPGYTGKAIKMGAGVQGFEAQAAAHQIGLTVTGGMSTTFPFSTQTARVQYLHFATVRMGYVDQY